MLSSQHPSTRAGAESIQLIYSGRTLRALSDLARQFQCHPIFWRRISVINKTFFVHFFLVGIKPEILILTRTPADCELAGDDDEVNPQGIYPLGLRSFSCGPTKGTPPTMHKKQSWCVAYPGGEASPRGPEGRI